MRGVADLILLWMRQWEHPQRTRRRQEARLRRLVRHAYSNVPYYRRLFDKSGLRPDDIRTIQDLDHLPLTSRKDLQSLALDEITARNVDLARCLRTRTSGTTGVPLEILTLPSDRSSMSVSFAFVYLAWGVKPWDRLAFLQARRELLGARSWYEHLGIWRRKNLAVSDGPELWVSELEAWAPRLLQGYALTLKLFAETLREASCRPVRTPFVVSTSGTLDLGGRRLIEQTLGERVIDIYASEEAGGVIAWQCPECVGYHVNNQNLIVELLSENRPAAVGEPAEVVLTNLTNYTMPFIRYRQDDFVTASTALPRCGRSAPLIAEIQGRSSDVIVLPSGKRLTSHPFFMVLDNIAGIAEWRLVQTRSDELRAEVCLSGKEPGQMAEELTDALRPLLGNEVRIDVRFVEEIYRDPSRKLRSIVSELTSA